MCKNREKNAARYRLDLNDDDGDEPNWLRFTITNSHWRYFTHTADAHTRKHIQKHRYRAIRLEDFQFERMDKK